MADVYVTGSFDNLNSRHVRFLQEAGSLGSLHVWLWDDETVRAVEGREPEFPLNERFYLLESLRYVSDVHPCTARTRPDALPVVEGTGESLWVMREGEENTAREAFCQRTGVRLRLVPDSELSGFPLPEEMPAERNKKVVVTGCYDWFHSGHVRFFEEAAQFGDLYVGVGSDATVRDLKGAPHPLFGEDERRYMVQSVRFVTRAFINSGSGWLDAAPDIERLKPDYYIVNEDGDRPEKRRFCDEHGLEYVVLRRLPRSGLPSRESTILRGF